MAAYEQAAHRFAWIIQLSRGLKLGARAFDEHVPPGAEAAE
jgi:hypothetical protein